MGKTVQIDDDVMRAAERLAAERGVTPDQVISEAARKTLAEPAETGPVRHNPQEWLVRATEARPRNGDQ
ncbi:MAG TPA: CopG family transcriptional regulator [Burkholderiales bacterium]|jgi:antitoxin component of RelBE/YafQ-DinJ toxin-antitoxin module|nr:CopG family transcriptional regulator [Burkholderiales bacterium]